MSSSPSSQRTQSTSLSPLLHAHSSSLSRPSSRTSIRSARAPSPSVIALDDPVAVRNQMSTLKHTIRHQQAQLHNLENIILRGPRPVSLDTDMMDTSYSSQHSPPPPSAPPPSYIPPSTSSSTKVKRRSSYDVLQGIAGPESSLPLPRRDGAGTPSIMDDGGIREGIPMSFGVGPASPQTFKRTSSPTRTLSRIPVASVGNARALADEGQPATHRPISVSATSKLSPLDIDNNAQNHASTSALAPPLSPNRRMSMTPGGTTKVLADLQTGVVNARNALENTKAQLRLSQRSVAQLTRQSEDLKEVRERLRLENEGLNNVVARKERLLQEVLERARKAESEAATLKSQLKAETTTSKKSMREMELALSESTALSQKSEREYVTLRDSIKGLVESWKSDMERLREEMKRREDKWRAEAESAGKKYIRLVEEIQAVQGDRGTIKALREENSRINGEVERTWTEEIERLKGEVVQSSKESEVAVNTARDLSNELARLRRLMQNAGSSPTGSQFPVSNDAEEHTPP